MSFEIPLRAQAALNRKERSGVPTLEEQEGVHRVATPDAKDESAAAHGSTHSAGLSPTPGGGFDSSRDASCSPSVGEPVTWRGETATWTDEEKRAAAGLTVDEKHALHLLKAAFPGAVLT